MSFLWRHSADKSQTNQVAHQVAFSSSSAAPAIPNISRYGLTEVFAPSPPSSALVDVVLVHGLSGHPQKTWTSKKTGVFWPSQLLPQQTEQSRLRVLTYGYDADPASTSGQGASNDMIHDHSERLVAELDAKRRDEGAAERPLIFVGHSLGGLVIKRALIYSSEIMGEKTEHLRSVFISTIGILFMGTPHKGSEIGAWGTYLEWLCHAVVPKKILDTQPHLVSALRSNSETLQNIDNSFLKMMGRFNIFYFYEAKPTDIKGTYRYIVDKESAAPNLPDVERAGIQADHSSMCKFDDDHSPAFDLVVNAINRYASDSTQKIPLRWAIEKENQSNLRKGEILEKNPKVMRTLDPSDPGSLQDSFHSSTGDLRNNQLLRGSDSHSQSSSTRLLEPSPQISEPLYFVPPGFRANSYFVGRDDVLKELDEHLFDSRREIGTACVLLHGQPGVGKSHLACQYVTTNRDKFPGGVFWLNAHSQSELEHDFWMIAQKMVARVSPDMLTVTKSAPHSYVEVVQEWFKSRRNWLIVLDHVTVESNEDLEALQKFIPDSNHSSLIYISRPRRLASMQRLLRPHAIKVPPLKPEDARRLLFLELGIEKPRTAQIKNADKLVKHVGGLPLAVSAIARRIDDTGQLVERFHIKSYSDDPELGDTYRSIIDDMTEHGHRYALNLMALLCFFGPHIPVEMVRLGLKALKSKHVEVRLSEDGGQPDLNASFGILMRHALLERNEPEDNASSPSDSRSSIEPDPIDILNISLVVSKFFADSLASSGELPFWLGLAGRLFVCSYQEAVERIGRCSEPPRVSDYRQYLTHGQSLIKNIHDYRSSGEGLREIRDGLKPVLAQIEDKIKELEPESSQSSVEQREFQKSVFDRSFSSSSSARSEEQFVPPPRRLGPSSLDDEMEDENEYGIPLTRPQSYSPQSIEFPRPLGEVNLANTSPPTRFLQYYGDQIGGEAMEKEQSGSTVRPGSSPPIPSPDWENMPLHRRRVWKQPTGLGSFRPVSTTANIDPVTARPFLPQRSDSTALSSLANFARPKSSQTPRTWYFLPQRSSNAPARVDTNLGHPGSAVNPTQSMPAQPASTQSSLLGSLHATYSPPGFQLLPPEGSENTGLQSSSSATYPAQSSLPPPGRIIGDRSSSSSPLRAAFSAQDLQDAAYLAPSVSGPNPNPLPHIVDISITAMPVSPEAPYQSVSSPSTPPRPHSVPSTDRMFPPPGMAQALVLGDASEAAAAPLGYYSQPVSRDQSHQSLGSGTATEPPPQTPFSPPAHSSAPISQRARGQDGSPRRKSPKFAFQAPADRQSPAGTPPSQQTSLAGAGAWAPSTDPLPQNSPPSPRQGRPTTSSSISGGTAPRSTAMGRHGSGPGILVRDSSGGRHGLGIAPFGEQPTQIVPVRSDEDVEATAANQQGAEGLAPRNSGGDLPLAPGLSSTSLYGMQGSVKRPKAAPYPAEDRMPSEE